MEGALKHVRAVAVCPWCLTDTFRLFIYTCGNAIPWCSGCGKKWEAPDWGKPDYGGGDEAVASAGDEPADLVSAAAGTEEVGCPVCEARRAAKAARMKKWRAKK